MANELIEEKMYAHLGCFNWDGNNVHLYYSLEKLEYEDVDDTGLNKGTKSYSCMLIAVSPRREGLTEFVRKRFGKFDKLERHHGNYYFLKGCTGTSMIEIVDSLRPVFNIKPEKIRQMKDQLIVERL